MTSTFVLVGGPFEIYDTAHSGEAHLFNCGLGAQFQMDEGPAHRAIREGAALLPKDRYDALGITIEETQKYPNAARQAAAPADDPIHAKLLAARQALHDYRAELAAAFEEGAKE